MKKDKFKTTITILLSVLIVVMIVVAFVLIRPDIFEKESNIESALKKSVKKEANAVIEEVIMDYAVNTTKQEEFKADFMLGCVDEDYEMKNYCNCLYDYLVNEFGYKELINQSLDFISGNISDKMVDVMIIGYFECEEYIIY